MDDAKENADNHITMIRVAFTYQKPGKQPSTTSSIYEYVPIMQPIALVDVNAKLHTLFVNPNIMGSEITAATPRSYGVLSTIAISKMAYTDVVQMDTGNIQ